MSDNDTVELRRYPSRKLYNKNSSSYVRLPEVAEMVRRGATVRVEELSAEERREEIARMLAGAAITDAAREAATSLLREAS